MGTENKPLLSIKNLKTIFDLDEGSVKAVDGVSFDIFPQRVLGIVGESGCGKSMTALSIMNMIPNPPGRISSGSIYLNDEDLLKYSSSFSLLFIKPAILVGKSDTSK